MKRREMPPLLRLLVSSLLPESSIGNHRTFNSCMLFQTYTPVLCALCGVLMQRCSQLLLDLVVI